jgi:hypothetical protein
MVLWVEVYRVFFELLWKAFHHLLPCFGLFWIPNKPLTVSDFQCSSKQCSMWPRRPSFLCQVKSVYFPVCFLSRSPLLFSSPFLSLFSPSLSSFLRLLFLLFCYFSVTPLFSRSSFFHVRHALMHALGSVSFVYGSDAVAFLTWPGRYLWTHKVWHFLGSRLLRFFLWVLWLQSLSLVSIYLSPSLRPCICLSLGLSFHLSGFFFLFFVSPLLFLLRLVQLPLLTFFLSLFIHLSISLSVPVSLSFSFPLLVSLLSSRSAFFSPFDLYVSYLRLTGFGCGLCHLVAGATSSTVEERFGATQYDFFSCCYVIFVVFTVHSDLTTSCLSRSFVLLFISCFYCSFGFDYSLLVVL